MPLSESFTISSLEARFLLPEGTQKSLVTKVTERTFAKVQYEDAVAGGKTAVLSYSTT